MHVLNLQANSSVHTITKGCPIAKPPEIFDHPLTSPPSPKMGTRPLLSQNKHPIVGCLGAAAWSFCLMGWARLPGKQYSTGLRPGSGGVTWSSRSKMDSRWESITCERCGGLQVRQSQWTSASKCRCGEIRCPHGCSYQDRALIHCKQSIIAAPLCINHTA